MEAEEKKAIDELKSKLQRKVKSRGLDVSYEDISDEIDDAIEFVNNTRGFKPTSTCLYEKKYNSLIVKLALAAIAKYGAEGENLHNENGVYRAYGSNGDYPSDLVKQIVPLAKVGGSL